MYSVTLVRSILRTGFVSLMAAAAFGVLGSAPFSATASWESFQCSPLVRRADGGVFVGLELVDGGVRRFLGVGKRGVRYVLECVTG